MLRITANRENGQCRLELSGRLYGPWVRETEKVWLSAACSGEEIEVDLREVTGVDGAGCKLLVAMHEAGARFVAKGVAMTALIEEITGKLPCNGDKRQRRRNAPKDADSEIRRESK
jgi:ABC-type transporter Mla MlaB component